MNPQHQQLNSKLEARTIKDTTTGCWLFEGYITSHGYGSFRLDGKKHLVHRLSALIYLDFDLSSELQVNHRLICFNKNCWNPDHLYIGTQADNIQDTILAGMHVTAGKGGATHCVNGHLYDAENTHINNQGNRICIECRRTNARNKYKEKQQNQTTTGE